MQNLSMKNLEDSFVTSAIRTTSSKAVVGALKTLQAKIRHLDHEKKVLSEELNRVQSMFDNKKSSTTAEISTLSEAMKNITNEHNCIFYLGFIMSYFKLHYLELVPWNSKYY